MATALAQKQSGQSLAELLDILEERGCRDGEKRPGKLVFITPQGRSFEIDHALHYSNDEVQKILRENGLEEI